MRSGSDGPTFIHSRMVDAETIQPFCKALGEAVYVTLLCRTAPHTYRVFLGYHISKSNTYSTLYPSDSLKLCCKQISMDFWVNRRRRRRRSSSTRRIYHVEQSFLNSISSTKLLIGIY